MPDLTQAEWDEVRVAYEESYERVADIAVRFGIPRTTIQSRAVADGWLPRAMRRANWVPSSEHMIRRLYQYLDRKLAQMEARMDNDEELTVADHERETRALGQLIRNFEKVSDLNGELQDGADGKRHGPTEHDASDQPDDPHRLRNELAERILRLREKQAAQDG